MADEIRTLKNGRLYLLKDGSSANDFAQASVSSGCLTSLPNGNWAAIMEESGDLHVYTGDGPASIQAGTPSTALAPSGGATKPVAYNDGTRLHLWFAGDEGLGIFDLRYTFSGNNGASFGSISDLNVVGDSTWCNDDVWPLYFEFEGGGADTHYLWCVGNNGGAYTLGRVTLDTSGGAFNVQAVLAANYTAAASAVSSHDFDTEHVAMVKVGGKYCVYYGNSPVAGQVYFGGGATVAGIDFSREAVFYTGVSGTEDDSFLHTYSVAVHQGMFHLLFGGNDGGSTTARLAVGENPQQLAKVPWVDPSTFGGADIVVSYAADLSFTMPDQSQHVMERSGPGALIDARFEPTDISFTMRQVGNTSTINSATDWLTGGIGPQAGQDSATDLPSELGRLNVVYITEDKDGNPAEYWMFPYVGFSTFQVAEGAEGNVITATGRLHNMQRPLFGRIV